MKHLLSIIAFLALVLTSCANNPGSLQANTPTAPASVQSTEEDAPEQSGSDSSVEIVGGDEESYREFIRKWIVPVSPDGTSQEVTVYIGSTPNDVPYELPVPEGPRVIGSITGNWVDYILIFESSQTPEAVHEFYAQALQDKGWQEPSRNPGGGFTSGSDSYEWYCYGENEAFLTVETQPASVQGTGIRLSLDLSPDSFVCSAEPNTGANYVNLIPQLNAPRGVTTQGGSAGSSDRDAAISANLRGNISAAELVEFYNEQLVAAGWEMQSEDQGDGAAWSNWTFQDEQGADWIGALMVVEVSAESNALFATVTILKSN